MYVQCTGTDSLFNGMLPLLPDDAELRPVPELPADASGRSAAGRPGIPVSRKKILTVTHPSDAFRHPPEQARRKDVHPCADVRSYPVSPL
jgi:hypothetical protein